MILSADEKLEILSDILPELERFRMKATNFKDAVETHELADFMITRQWKAVQRASHDLREALAHVTRENREKKSGHP